MRLFSSSSLPTTTLAVGCFLQRLAVVRSFLTIHHPSAPSSQRTTRTTTTSTSSTTGTSTTRPSTSSRSLVTTATTTTTSKSQLRMASTTSKKDQAFPTWSFDKPCLSMEWTKFVDVQLTMELGTDNLQADLVLVGLMAPPKETSKGGESGADATSTSAAAAAATDEDEDDDDDTGADKDKATPPPVALSGVAQTLDEAMGGALSELLQDQAKTFKNGAKLGSMTPTLRAVGAPAKRYAVMGLGPASDNKDWTGAGFALGKAIAAKCHDEKGVKSCRVVLPDLVTTNRTQLQDLATAFYENLYTDNRYRTGSKVKKTAEDLTSVVICSEATTTTTTDPVDNTALEVGRTIASGVFLTKDIVNAPHNVLNSVSLADTAKRIAETSGGLIRCTILDKKECEKRGMGAYLGVARGSETDPQFIHLTYRPKSGPVHRVVGIAGKGLLFDTGGYNIKTQMMEYMKFDCGGAGAVLGAAKALAQLQPPGVEAHFVVAACENMINDKSIVPSDILTASNGKTIEIMNTDAEGRLTLADALVFLDKEVGCEKIIELSTLTGACMVSLGKDICGLWTSNDELANELAEISKITGDKSWRMPLASKEYSELLESKFADLKNIGGKYGGAITAALFLQEFVSKKKPFAHLDIAGPVWSDKIGATGFGNKLVVEWVKRQGQPPAKAAS